MLTRRAFVSRLGAAIALAQTSGAAALLAKSSPVHADLGYEDALNGLLAFVVPGSDPFSHHQGVFDASSGGVDAGVLDALVEILGGPPGSQFVAGVLDSSAGIVKSEAGGFAGLTFNEKMHVFELLEGHPGTALLAEVLLAVTAFLVYSEAGVDILPDRTLSDQPLGWQLTGYEGVADGRDEFVGYYRGRKKAQKRSGKKPGKKATS